MSAEQRRIIAELAAKEVELQAKVDALRMFNTVGLTHEERTDLAVSLALAEYDLHECQVSKTCAFYGITRS